MTDVLALQGIRGGVGTTSLVAGLGDALHRLGERVLMVDASPDNLLGLHFNLPVDEADGWAHAELAGRGWREAAFEVEAGLVLVPYGLADASQAETMEDRLRAGKGFWEARCAGMGAHFDWILFDLPRGLAAHASAVVGSGLAPLLLRVATLDAGCHVLLQRHGIGSPHGFVVANRHDPAVQLQRDLAQLWAAQLGPRWISKTVHEDAAVAEALAMKSPVARYRPQALASIDLESLAVWCMAQAGRRERG